MHRFYRQSPADEGAYHTDRVWLVKGETTAAADNPADSVERRVTSGYTVSQAVPVRMRRVVF